MNATVNPAAPHHLPFFITEPGHADVLLAVTALILLAAVVGFGVLFFWLHNLPERIAHKRDKLQMEIVAVLCLISLFTHIHLFWVIGLLLAMIDIPNFGGWMSRIARSTETIAGITPPPEEVPEEVETTQVAPQPAPRPAQEEAVHA
jgi:multisubunit Na+/H+ antiporter MnhF subunit